MKRLLFACALCLPLIGFATDLKPWYARYLEIQPKATYLFQTYKTIDTGHGTIHQSSDDQFLHLSVLGAYDRWCAEIETTFAATRHRSFGFCDARLTGRYQWLDDVVGDPVSLVTGLTVVQSCKIAVHDISCFYHGDFETEIHVAAGKEVACEQFWTSRVWGVLGLGVADVGSPWIRGNFAWEYNWCDLHEVEIGAYTLWGLGGDSLNVNHFRGYGPIKHYSIDVGLNYHMTLECGGVLGIGYYHRLFARNCPKHVNILELSYLYPFGL